MNINENVRSIKEKIAAAALAAGRSPEDIQLVAASKTRSPEEIRTAVAAGVEIFGENRVQELREKLAQNAYAGAQIHFIGHLQKNKVRQVVGACSLIQSGDSDELLRLIDRRASELQLVQNVLLEVNIGGEASKSGFAPKDLPRALETAAGLSHLRVRGLMCVPPICSDPQELRAYFVQMRQLFVDISTKKYDNIFMDFLSMGMSGDFETAIAEGSNMVRIGSAIFGPRQYPQKAD